jgi:hypothetical protein
MTRQAILGRLKSLRIEGNLGRIRNALHLRAAACFQQAKHRRANRCAQDPENHPRFPFRKNMSDSLYHTRDSLQQIFASKFVSRHFGTTGSEREFTPKGLGACAAAFGYLPPIGGAIAQEIIDLAAVLNAVRVALPTHSLTDF